MHEIVLYLPVQYTYRGMSVRVGDEHLIVGSTIGETAASVNSNAHDAVVDAMDCGAV